MQTRAAALQWPRHSINRSAAIRIVQLIASTRGPRFGGMERHVADLCLGLSRQHEVHALAHPAFSTDLGEDVRFHPMNMQWPHFDPRLLLAILRTLCQIKPDIVHAHGRKASRLLHRLRRWLPSGCKSLATIHNLGKCVPSGLDGCIAVSHAIARQCECPAEVIYNGIEFPPTPPTKPPFQPHAPRLISVGRLVPTKGFDLLLQALAEVPDAHLQIVGDGPDRSRLEQQAARLGLINRVRFSGHCDDVPDRLQQADLCVIASRREGFSYVFAESLRAGTPVLATDVPVANEFLPARFIVPGENPAALAIALRNCLDNLPALQADFTPLFQRARDELSSQAMLSRTEAYYRQLLQRPV